jgi:predicted transcriptional regulator
VTNFNKDIERLKTLLEMDESNEELVRLLNEMLVDSKKRQMLLIKLDEIKKELSILSSDIRLTKSEQAVKSIVLSSKKPLTAQEVASIADIDARSLQYTARASSVLNSLVNKGIIGKYKSGYSYYYSTPTEAVFEQLKHRGESLDNNSPSQIAKETGMRLSDVIIAIEELRK